MFKGVVIAGLGMILCLGVALFAVLDTRPIVTEASAPNSRDVVQAQNFVMGIRAAVAPAQSGPAEFTTTPEQLDSVLKLGARIVPGFRGRVALDETSAVIAHASIPVPLTGLSRWINLSAKVPAFDGGLKVADLSVGPLSLPPKPTLILARATTNAVLGNGLGDTIFEAAQRMNVDGDKVVFAMAMDDVGTNGILRGVFGSLRGSDMPTIAEIDRFYVGIRDAMEAGDLPPRGSYLPYVVFTLNQALDAAPEMGVEHAFTASIFALTVACGTQDFGLIVGFSKRDNAVTDKGWATTCRRLKFNGRTDSRRHFTTAAALQAASNRGLAVSMGEYKELYDAVEAGGFDFTDIAANNSGIRLANTMMAAPLAIWPDLIARMEEEGDVIIAFDGLPETLSDAAFEAEYGDVESPAYHAQLAEIEQKIDALALHQ